MKNLSKLASLLAIGLFVVGVIACKQPTGNEISGGGSGGSGSIGIERLPGTAGGSANSKDIFAGKTFYDNADNSQANEKYVFGTDGTFTSYWRSNSEPTFTDSSDSINPTCEYKYSLSNDGNIIYYAINKTSVEDDAGNEQLMSYDEVCKAGKDEYKEDFFGVRMYDISEETDDAGKSYKSLSGTVDSSSGDLSKMAFGGCFENVDGSGLKIDGTEHKFKFFIDFYGSEIQLGETTHAAYKTTKIDSSKLYFEKCLSETTTDADAFEVAYNVTGSGKDTKITVTFPEERGGQVLELKFDSSSKEFYSE